MHVQNRRTAVSDPAVDAAALRRAVHDGQLVAWYQPIIDLSTGSAVGVEALARWPRPDGMIPPAEFIPLAEASDLVIELDLAIIRHALAALRRWQRTRPGFELSINLSGRHLDSPTGVTELVAMVEAAAVAPGTICVELVRKIEMSPYAVRETGVSHLPRLHGRSQFFRVKSLFNTFYQLLRLYLQVVILGHWRTDRKREAPAAHTVEHY